MDVPINDLKVWQTPKVEQLRPTQISMFAPSADEAMAELVQLFSDPSLASKAQFRCFVDGPTEFEVLFESIVVSTHPGKRGKISQNPFVCVPPPRVSPDLFQQVFHC
jgi:hypothetical protein